MPAHAWAHSLQLLQGHASSQLSSRMLLLVKSDCALLSIDNLCCSKCVWLWYRSSS